MATSYVTSNPTVTVSGAPDVGVITTVALYVPGVKLAAFTMKVTAEAPWAAMLPLTGTTDSQDGEDITTVHDSDPPPLFVKLMTCG